MGGGRKGDRVGLQKKGSILIENGVAAYGNYNIFLPMQPNTGETLISENQCQSLMFSLPYFKNI